MKLRDVDVIVVGNPPPGFGGRYFIFVKVTTACGIVGWGECYASTVGPEAMRAVIADVFARHMEGENPENVELMFRRCYSAGFTQRPDPTVMGAFSGLEIACWDILGKARDRPVHALWGGRMWDRLRSYSYLYPGPDEQAADFYNNPEASAAEAARMVERGFTAIKFDPAGAYTLRGGHQPTMPDIERSAAFCREIRAAVGDRADLLFGTHGQFTPSGALRLAQAIEPYHPLWFEEPVPPDAPLDFATVAAGTRIPIATGERLSTKIDFAVLLRSGGVGMVQPNVGRVGGLLEARKVAILAEAYSVQLAPHIYCGPVAWAASVQLGLSVPNFLVLETIGTCDGFYGALIGNTIQWEDGYVAPPTGPGLGIEVDEDLARAHPWQGDRLHLEMSEEPPDPRGESRFAGG